MVFHLCVCSDGFSNDLSVRILWHSKSFLSVVCLLMSFLNIFMCKCFVTSRAIVWLLFCVCAFMYFQTRSPCKFLVTLGTGEWFLISVRSLMSFLIDCLCEFLISFYSRAVASLRLLWLGDLLGKKTFVEFACCKCLVIAYFQQYL